MPALTCPRCQRSNPDIAVFCYFDGAELRPSFDGGARARNQLAQDFVFPSGRRCRTFDDLAQACQDDWAVARDLLKQGVFKQFFTGTGRADLARVAQDSMVQADPDIALTTFLNSLPVSGLQTPKLDLNPRRLILGSLLAGETRQVQLHVSNQGKGVLQGTLSVAEGGEWLKIPGGSNGHCALKTARDQQVTLQIDTRGVPAGQPYGAMLKVITNGGVVEVPARMELMAHPFPRSPFQGAKTPREIAEHMRRQPKAAVPLLETGEVSRWFTSNGWNFPVRGTPAKGVAGVQQFFEAMGLSKPPVVQLSQSEVRLSCNYPQAVRYQLLLQTSARKWVYASVQSDSPWLKVVTPHVSGPQQASIGFEVDSRYLPAGNVAEGKLQISANAGQTLSVRVLASAQGAPVVRTSRLLQPLVTMALAFLLLRLLLVPFVDLTGRGAAVAAAAARVNQAPGPDSPLARPGGWLTLPWPTIMLARDNLDAAAFNPGGTGPVPVTQFRHYFVSYFVRHVVLYTWWIGAVIGGLVCMRRGGVADFPMGVIAGAVAGVMGSATLGSVVLLFDFIPHLLGQGIVSSGGVGMLMVWIVLALVCWTAIGAVLGMLVAAIKPLRELVLVPLQHILSGLFRLCGLYGLARYASPA